MFGDCHMHMVLDGIYYKDAIAAHRGHVRDDLIRAVLAQYQAAGITYLRDGGDAFGASMRAKELAGEYGIEYRVPVFPMCLRGRYGAFIGRPFDTLKDYREMVKEVARQGGDFIKIMISGIMDFDRYGVITSEPLTRAQIREMIDIAHGEGFAVMVHVNGKEAVKAAASCMDSIEHGYFGDEDVLSTMAESGVVWVPTLAAVSAFVGRPGFNEEVAALTLKNQLAMLRKAESLGVSIACGSDSGAVGVPHGEGTHTELRLLKEAGLSDETIAAGNEKIRRIFRKQS